ncbi:hypothetical protein CERZMDRAFT_93894 [Cercospora zeae-maydis SCOH1-5]|uniref:Uncharacterized protein n=1 Tax=Cercospora zeae-maydis SCOH1-5 TaxID=717836 RepID=A0A6A6FSY3_9PEZI|nr:hypothetical protein CERZMDRAFT_93894 [Cercospora zeae-maydis SCOH1-5]
MNKTYFDDDAMCKPDNAVLKRTKVYGNKKRLITSTSSAAERATRTNPVSRVQQTQEVRPARGLYSASLPDPKVIRYVPTYPKIHRDHLDLATLQYYDLPWEYSKAWHLYDQTSKIRANRVA